MQTLDGSNKPNSNIDGTQHGQLQHKLLKDYTTSQSLWKAEGETRVNTSMERGKSIGTEDTSQHDEDRRRWSNHLGGAMSWTYNYYGLGLILRKSSILKIWRNTEATRRKEDFAGRNGLMWLRILQKNQLRKDSRGLMGLLLAVGSGMSNNSFDSGTWHKPTLNDSISVDTGEEVKTSCGPN